MDEAMKRFVDVLNTVIAQRKDAYLVSKVNLKELELAPGYYLEEWRFANVDEWRRIRSMQGRAPFRSVLPPGVGEGVDYSCAGRPAEGLGAAHLMDGVLVSLLVDTAWDASWIQAERTSLAEDPEGEPVVIDDIVEVRHAATLAHVDSHLEWLKQVGIPDLKHGSQIWDARGDLYPKLLFLPRTERQFANLRQDWVVSAAHELRRIDHAIGDWNPQLTRTPTWRSKVTPEGETRKRLCRFEDFDGIMRVFDLHGRFTPDEGRAYFRLVPEMGKATVANIGLKLGI
ncbi:hypothetical protein [Thermomonospora umbrina]|uniref:hypothetical protein n=1 Tax=Thermomonospora umbrina TaxID=111806 RepID=UPI000E26CC3F|nr:hypothetical protein [Thermomonospora umbrina]